MLPFILQWLDPRNDRLRGNGHEGVPLAYVEVTTVNQPASQETETNRENAVYNAIDNAKLPPGTILGYRLVRAGKTSPRLRPPLVAGVERWAKDDAEAAKTKEVSKTFAAGDWVIELDLYAGGSGTDRRREPLGGANARRDDRSHRTCATRLRQISSVRHTR
jgi:hypothetical protein